MRSVFGLRAWLTCLLILMMNNLSGAQAPKAKEDEVKLPVLLQAKPLTVEPKDDELRKLLKARYNETISEVKALYEMYTAGRGGLELFEPAAQRLVHAGREVFDKPTDRIILLSQYVELTKGIETLARTRHEVGVAPSTELHRARYSRLDAEIQLLRIKREAEKMKDK